MTVCARGLDEPRPDREGAGDALRLPRQDWSARARSTALDALRYTKFVGVMKRALQVAAFAVVAAVLGFFLFQRQPAHVTMGFEQLGHVDNDLAMVKPRLSGQDDDGNPFVITADAAVQDAKNPKRAQLKKSKPISPWAPRAGSMPTPPAAR